MQSVTPRCYVSVLCKKRRRTISNPCRLCALSFAHRQYMRVVNVEKPSSSATRFCFPLIHGLKPTSPSAAASARWHSCVKFNVETPPFAHA